MRLTRIQESLASSFDGMGLPEDALQVYSELEASFSQALRGMHAAFSDPCHIFWSTSVSLTTLVQNAISPGSATLEGRQQAMIRAPFYLLHPSRITTSSSRTPSPCSTSEYTSLRSKWLYWGKWGG
jgi:hypothetical protein